MAKSFKNLTPPNTTTSIKRDSERDFLDQIEDAQATDQKEVLLAATNTPTNARLAEGNDVAEFGDTNRMGKSAEEKQANKSQVKNKVSSSVNIGNTSKPGNTTHTDNSRNSGTENTVTTKKGGENPDVRQTFILGQEHLEKLRDHVHARKAGGDYNYSQKQALQEALDLLFASGAPVAPRPDQVRELEQQRREQIQQGRLARG